jgi:hypothetical protein
MGIHVLLGLSSSVTDLCPEVVAVAGGCLSPALEGFVHGFIRLPVNHHVAGTLKVVSIDLYVAGKQNTRPTIAPNFIKAFQLGRGDTCRCRQALGHRRFCQAIGDNSTARQGE